MSELVSVVIPTYNRAAYLRDAVESVLVQTFTDTEIIVIEDGSYVAKQELERYGTRIRYIWQPNRGVATARNTGVREANGKWIAFLDDDDLWLPEKLTQQIALIRDCPALGLVHTHHFMRSGERQWLDSRVYMPAKSVPSGYVTNELLFHNFIVTSSTLVRRDLFSSLGGFRTEFQTAEDYDLWLRLSMLAPIGFVREPLVIYRVHGRALTSDRKRVRVATIAALKSFWENVPEFHSKCKSYLVRQRLSKLHLQCAMDYLSCGRYAEARQYCVSAWIWNRWLLRSALWALILMLPDSMLECSHRTMQLIRPIVSVGYKWVRRILGIVTLNHRHAGI